MESITNYTWGVPDDDGIRIFSPNAHVKSEMYITPLVKIQFTHPMPNWWFRMWYRLLLGWVWKKVG